MDAKLLSRPENQDHLLLPALIVARHYKCRWTVELFFKWIKQHLRIKTFYGTLSNAVKTQVWIAICVYLLGAKAKKLETFDTTMTDGRDKV